MNRLLAYGTALAWALTAMPAGAQVTKTIQGEMKTVTVSVEAVDRGNRQLTVKKPDGTYDVLYASPEIKRFDAVKVGDKITAKYYDNMVLRLKLPGEKDVDTAAEGLTRTEGAVGGTASRQRVVTAAITAIDPAVPSITFTGPRGWTYSSRVQDKKALAKVKVGDKVEITWTEALVLSLDEAK